MAIVVRSLVYNVLFYLVLVLYSVAAAPVMLMAPHAMRRFASHWGRANVALLRLVCGTRVEFRGIENIPPGALIVAAKHQSAWETFALLQLFADPIFVLKRELLWLPFFGWYAWKAEQIPVDRDRGARALKALVARVRAALAKNAQIIIFPEGTRRAAGAPPDYKPGLTLLYAATGTPCLPIALNSGLFWPRRSFLRYPGTIRVEILPPIAPGLSKDAFAARLRQEIEAATARLVAEGERELRAANIRPVTAAS